ncbi:hypothetical protein Tco_0731931 [Tanacetum coccineum]
MTTPVIDLTKSQSDSPLPTSTTTTSTITTTTILPPPPPQSTTDPILVRRIGELEQHIADLIQNNLALEESKAVDEIVTGAVDWAMQAPLRARFKDLPTVDMKEILQQRMFEDNTYKTHEEEPRKKKRKRCESPRTPPRSPPKQPPTPPPLAGASDAPADILRAQELSPTDYLMQDDSIPEEHVHFSDDEDSENDHQPKADSRKDCWKPLPKEERPATPKPTWTIPSSNKSDVVNNWASTLATTYEPPAENSLLAKIRDMTTFMNWYCQKVNKTMHTQEDFKGQAYKVVKAFYPDAIHLQYQLEECHKMLTDQWFNQQKFYINRHDSPSRRKEVRTHMRILSVIRVKAYSRYGYDYLSKIVLQRADFQEHTIAEKDLKNLYPSDFKDLNLFLLQGHLDHLPGLDKRMLSIAVKL